MFRTASPEVLPTRPVNHARNEAGWVLDRLQALENDAASSARGIVEAGAQLLLVDDESATRLSLRRALTAKGFAVTEVGSAQAALAAAAEATFAYAAVEIRLSHGDGGTLVERLRKLDPFMRIVVITEFDSFASVIVALRAGAIDYLAKPVRARELENALLGRPLPPPLVPDTPLGVRRVCWEHIQRIFEQCDRNVTRTAQQLGMHRRTLQRVLGKRSPRPRPP